jgi:lipoprotein NlpD
VDARGVCPIRRGLIALLAVSCATPAVVGPLTHAEPDLVEQAAPVEEERPPPAPVERPQLSWPLHGVLYARFGKKGKEPHDGIDLAAPAGTSVKTAAPGKVLFAGEQKGYGNLAIVEHEGGMVTLYAHNRDLRVKAGQRVREGQVIATVGESGKTSGPHLHFEVRKGGVPVDPLQLLSRP